MANERTDKGHRKAGTKELRSCKRRFAWLVLLPLPPITEVESGGLPIDRAQGDFLLAITLTTLAAALASILPARRAARIDPVEAIGS